MANYILTIKKPLLITCDSCYILKNRDFSQILRDTYFSGKNYKREDKKD
jgi:hypothetical protein